MAERLRTVLHTCGNTQIHIEMHRTSNDLNCRSLGTIRSRNSSVNRCFRIFRLRAFDAGAVGQLLLSATSRVCQKSSRSNVTIAGTGHFTRSAILKISRWPLRLRTGEATAKDVVARPLVCNGLPRPSIISNEPAKNERRRPLRVDRCGLLLP